MSCLPRNNLIYVVAGYLVGHVDFRKCAVASNIMLMGEKSNFRNGQPVHPSIYRRQRLGEANLTVSLVRPEVYSFKILSMNAY